MVSTTYSEEKLLQEKCGIVTLYAKNATNQLKPALLAAIGVQHRGTHGAGVAYKTDSKAYKYTDSGLIHEVFTPNVVKKLSQKSKWLIFHTRYGTNGGYSKKNIQPCTIKTKDGDELAIAHNGEFVGLINYFKLHKLPVLKNVSDTYLFTYLLSKAKGANWKEKVLSTLDKVTGAYSVVIGINNDIFIARDPHGIRPLIIGKMRGQWMIASETHAFDKVGAKVMREVKRGEVLYFHNGNMTVIRHGEKKPKHFCDFEWAYFGRPDSLLPPNGEGDKPSEWLSVSRFREQCGQELAKEIIIQNATFMVGVPDSGVPFAMGYATGSKMRYIQAIVRDHYDPHGKQRLFMRDDQMKRIRKKVLGKLSLIPDKRIWKDAIVVIGDDSIIRGNVSEQLTKAIFAMGAKEVHWIIGYPPVIKRCHLGVSIRTEEELIAARNKGDVDKIAKEIGATSIHYIQPDMFIRARLENAKLTKPQNPQDIFLANGGCGGCTNGRYPIDRDGNYTNIV